MNPDKGLNSRLPEPPVVAAPVAAPPPAAPAPPPVSAPAAAAAHLAVVAAVGPRVARAAVVEGAQLLVYLQLLLLQGLHLLQVTEVVF